ncbi:MAG TPA: DUF2975 domain-containing protein [Methylibium sp.]|uniref:DUF2975 domain-containing protein n=1 Tax=Methylibium sp. TaxID=2067992 RepID=UPI002DC04263|nr:DUF2975 domain-containing protein [Methylibium sp.]HEU4458803.1 DUF2975 domain-containing protein [Methylibium sp.]
MPRPMNRLADTPRERLRRLSRAMRVLVGIGALALACMPLWIVGQEPQQVLAWLHGVRPGNGPFTPPLPMHWIAAIASLPGVLLGLYGLWQLWQLFAAYGRGVVFGSEPTRRLRRLGATLVASAFLQPLVQTIVVLVLTANNPPGQRRLVLGFSSNGYALLLAGGLLWAIAWAMAEGARLQRENEGFV